MKILSRGTHGLVDYAVVVAFLSLPTALGFTGAPRTLSYSFAFLHLVITALSSFPPGALRLIHFPLHPVIEVVGGLFLIASPWLLRFSDQPAARNSFLMLGALLIVLAAFTDFERRRHAVPPPPGDRRRRYTRRNG